MRIEVTVSEVACRMHRNPLMGGAGYRHRVAAAAWLGARPALLLSAASAATYLLRARTVLPQRVTR